jgi:hypothetical protein
MWQTIKRLAQQPGVELSNKSCQGIDAFDDTGGPSLRLLELDSESSKSSGENET